MTPRKAPDSFARSVARGALYPLRLVSRVVLAPTRVAATVIDDRLDAEGPWTFGSLADPSEKPKSLDLAVVFDDDFGVTTGVGAGVSNLLGRGESVGLRALAFGRYRVGAELAMTSGHRIHSDTRLELRGLYAYLDEERYYGRMGNPGPLARYALERAEIAVGLRQRLPAKFTLYGEARLEDAKTEVSDDGMSMDMLYGDELGWADRVRLFQPSVRLARDTRRNDGSYMPATLYLHGSRLEVGAAYSEPWSAPAGVQRYGAFYADGEGIVPIYGPGRALAFRTFLGGIAGDADSIPFYELPSLGGQAAFFAPRDRLVGYHAGELRGAAVAMAGLEYRFMLNNVFHMALYSDVGRAFSQLRELELRDPRVGFGAAIELAASRERVIRSTFETSIDGGFAWGLQVGGW